MSCRGLGKDGSSVTTASLALISVWPTLLVQDSSYVPASSRVASLIDRV